MSRLDVTAAAEADLTAILAHVTKAAGPVAASRLAGRLLAAVDRIAAFPASGALRPGLGASTRVILVRPFLLIYDTGSNAPVLLRVLHERREVAERLLPAERM